MRRGEARGAALQSSDLLICLSGEPSLLFSALLEDRRGRKEEDGQESKKTNKNKTINKK